MLGVFQGLKITIKHFFSPKVTRMYPYEKRVLPERSRGLIQLITEPETGVLKCEACLLCEKVCPPRAITIRYEERNAFRWRPLARPKSKAAYYRPREVAAYPYEGPRPLSPMVLAPVSEADGDDAWLDGLLEEQGDLVGALRAIQERYGHLPRRVLMKLARNLGVSVSELFSSASLSPDLRLDPISDGFVAGATNGDSSALVLPGPQALQAVEQQPNPSQGGGASGAE